MRVGPYAVLGTVGRGAASVVLRARGPGGRLVAVKLLRRLDDAEVARFERERRLLAGLGEPDGFVPLLDSGEVAEGPYLVLPLLTGGSLRTRLVQGGPLPLPEALALGRTLAAALARAHARGLVHRDLKPENVLFTGEGDLEGVPEGRALVADLGLAKHWRADAPGASQSAHLSQTGELLGTPGYLAPEQARDARAATPAADVFALGAILFETLAGRPAFSGESLAEVLRRIVEGEPAPRLRRLCPEAPAWLEAVVARALAHDPLERPEDAGALGRELDAEGESAPATRRRALLLALGGALGLGASALGLALGFSLRPSGRTPIASSSPASPAPASPRATSPPARPSPSSSPESGAASLVDRARQELERGDLDAALADVSRAIELDPGRARAWALRGDVRRARRDYGRALPDLDRALDLAPDLVAALGSRGDVRRHLGDLEGAIADFARALEHSPGDGLFWLQRGLAHLARAEDGGTPSDVEQALADETRAIEIRPDEGEPWLYRGSARYLKGDVAGALADLDRAVALLPRVSKAWQRRGIARRARGDFEGAVADESRAIELDPAHPAAWMQRGFARERLGQRDLARGDLERGRALGGTHPDLEAALARLRE